jgi:hypothetical protein
VYALKSKPRRTFTLTTGSRTRQPPGQEHQYSDHPQGFSRAHPPDEVTRASTHASVFFFGGAWYSARCHNCCHDRGHFRRNAGASTDVSKEHAIKPAISNLPICPRGPLVRNCIVSLWERLKAETAASLRSLSGEMVRRAHPTRFLGQFTLGCINIFYLHKSKRGL